MKTVHCILGADLRCSHEGLKIQARSRGISLKSLMPGEAIVFINHAKNKMKAYSYNGVVSYIRFDDPKRGIDLNALDEFPKAFRPDGTMDYEKALRASLKTRLKEKKFDKIEVVSGSEESEKKSKIVNFVKREGNA